eukprot:1003747-Rhodomonas_salina.5
MPGTDLAYWTPRRRQVHSSPPDCVGFPISLRSCYTMPGTDVAYDLPTRYAMPGTEVPHAAIRKGKLVGFPPHIRTLLVDQVTSCAIQYRPTGTDLLYGAMLWLVLMSRMMIRQDDVGSSYKTPLQVCPHFCWQRCYLWRQRCSLC